MTPRAEQSIQEHLMDAVGRYQIKSELGRGGMATVYRAYDPRFKREVAVKVLPREFLHDTGFRNRFEREAQTIAALEHPAIVPVYDYGEADGILYLVMRYLPGGSLARRMAQGPLPLDETVRILQHLAPGLDHAHAQGMVHRDLKPGNVLFDAWKNPYLSDFGIVKLALSSETALTKTGGLVGTPAYMSPEQVRGLEELDGRSDVYALGVLLYQMLSGKLPYEADTPIGQAFMHVNAPVPAIGEVRRDLSPAVAQVVTRALAKEPEERQATAGDLAQNLAQAATPTTPRAQGAAAREPAPQQADVTASERRPISTATADDAASTPLPATETDTPAPEAPAMSREVPRWRLPIWGWGLLILVLLLMALGAFLGLPDLLPGADDDVTATSPAVVSRASTATSPPAPTETTALTETTAPDTAGAETPVAAENLICDDPLGCVSVAPGEPLRLASALDLSGPAAQLGLDTQRGVEMAIEARAEIAGHPLELRTEDSTCSREGGQAAAQMIVSDPSIVGLIGTSCSSAALPAAQIITENGYVMISPSNTTPGLTEPQTRQDGYFRTSHNDEFQGLAMAQFAYDELGARTAAAIHEGESYSEGLARVFGDAFVALGGEMIAIEPISPSAGEVRPLLDAIRDGGPPDFLYYPVFANVGAAITEQARQREGLSDTILAGSDGMLIPLFLENSGDDALGMFLSGPDLTFESPLYEDFLRTYEERYGEAPPAPFHAHAFDATNILLDAIEQVVQVGNDGTLLIGRQALRDAVAATTNHAGITGTLTCDENGDCADPRIAVYEVQDTGDGPAFVPIWTYAP